MTWARPSGVVYSGPGVYDLPLVLSPFQPSPPEPKPRKSPGDPRCPECRERKRGYCTGHKNYHYAYVASWSVD